MLDSVQRVNWDEYLVYLSQGHPSIALQLLALNAVIMILWLGGRARRRKGPNASTWMLQILFVAGNLGVITMGGWLQF